MNTSVHVHAAVMAMVMDTEKLSNVAENFENSGTVMDMETNFLEKPWHRHGHVHGV